MLWLRVLEEEEGELGRRREEEGNEGRCWRWGSVVGGEAERRGEPGRMVREEEGSLLLGAELGKMEVEVPGPMKLERTGEPRFGLMRGWCFSCGRKSREGRGGPDWSCGLERGRLMEVLRTIPSPLGVSMTSSGMGFGADEGRLVVLSNGMTGGLSSN